MKDIYLHRDRSRGMEKTILWLVSEVGELAEAVRLEKSQKMAEEMADVLAWLCSIANLAGISLEAAALKKYPEQCSRCDSKPCTCKES
jgi:NTP pyrophosphatase (non-canonical NTP hydrolase)